MYVINPWLSALKSPLIASDTVNVESAVPAALFLFWIILFIAVTASCKSFIAPFVFSAIIFAFAVSLSANTAFNESIFALYLAFKASHALYASSDSKAARASFLIASLFVALSNSVWALRRSSFRVASLI